MTVPQDSTGLRDSTGENLPSLATFSTFGASLTVAPLTVAVPLPLFWIVSLPSE